MMNFISGSLNPKEGVFEREYKPFIDIALLNNDAGFILGDARGIDTLAQNYLFGKTMNVLVCHMFTSPRNNAGFETMGGFQSDEERDEFMTLASNRDIAFVHRKGSGTEKNILRRIQMNSKKLKLFTIDYLQLL